MEEHGDEHEQHSPRWVPYTPPNPEGWDRVRLLLRRFSFPFALLLLGVGVAGVLYWTTQMEARTPSPAVNVQPSAVETGPEAPTTMGSAQLAVRSTPPGATVRINGDSVGVTPFADSARRAGAYMLSVQRTGHFRADTVVVLEAESDATVRLTLRQRPGYTEPDPVQARSPSRSQPSPDARSLPVTSVPDEATNAPPERTSAYGTLYVTSVPTGAVVTLDGTERGRTPLPVSELSLGTKQVSLRLDGYQPWSAQVKILADTTARLHADLQKKSGRLRVLARPWGTIYVNGTLHARESDVWYETPLPAGRHEVTVVHPALGKQTETVTVRPDKETSVVVDLRAKTNESSP